MTSVALKPSRPHVVDGETIQTTTGCGTMYVTVNRDGGGTVQETFLNLGKAGGCASAQNQAIGRLVCLVFALGGTAEQVARQLRGIQCNRPRSCSDAVAEVLADSDAAWMAGHK